MEHGDDPCFDGWEVWAKFVHDWFEGHTVEIRSLLKLENHIGFGMLFVSWAENIVHPHGV